MYFPTYPFPADGAVFPTFTFATLQMITFDGLRGAAQGYLMKSTLHFAVIEIAHRPQIESENEMAYLKHTANLLRIDENNVF